MTGEQVHVVESLRKTAKIIDEYYGTYGQRGCIEEAADMIERLSADLDAAKAENERIRQTHVRHGAYQMEIEKNRAMENDLINYEMNLKRMEDKLEQVKRERDAAVKDIPHDCYYCSNFVPGIKAMCKCGCEITPLSIYPHDKCKWQWRGPCAENGGGQK